MTQLYLNQITKLVAGRPLFTTEQLTAQVGDRIGIVGANGAGKTTLAKIIAGSDTDFSGQRQLAANVVRVPQIAPIQGQSGGQSMLARIRRALAQQPELLILDEPSANLDDQHQEWLIQTLLHFKGTLILISHDRNLLQAVATKLWVVRQGTFKAYNGTFAAYQTARHHQETNALTQYRQQQNERRKLQAAAQKKRQKAQKVRKGSRKMSAAERSNSRTLREQNAGCLERNARDLTERAAQQVTAVKPQATKGVKLMATDLPPVQGKYLINVQRLNLTRGKHRLLTDATLRVRPGERVALLGPNGSGKSTLLNALLSHHDHTHLAASARLGYFHQDMTALPVDQTVWQVMQRQTTLDAERTRQVMGAFGLNAAFYDRLVGELSGGERVKLQLLSILVSASNLLLLDEPTNYLDLAALQALAAYLVAYPGTVLFVAHDQAFRQQVATRTVRIDRQRLVDPQKTAQGQPASDLPRLQFEYDRLMQSPTSDPVKLRALRREIEQIRVENGLS